MIQFFNKFSKEAQRYNDEKINECTDLFLKFLDVVEDIDTKVYLTKTGSFNVSFFDSVFVAIAERIQRHPEEEVIISQDAFDKLKGDEDFDTAITHSTSHVQSVRTRLQLARKYLFGEDENGK